MNYINQLNGFFNKSNADCNLKPSHISLYTALFNDWNSNRFNNPTTISKDKVMKISKIYSNTTYYKCLKELESFGYIQLLLDHNPHSCSNVIMIDLTEYAKKGLKINQSKYPNFVQHRKTSLSKNGQHTEHVNEPAYILYNNKTNTNNINIDNGTSSNLTNTQNLNSRKNKTIVAGGKEEKSSAKKEEKYKSNSEIPELESVVSYFIFKLSTEAEGNKFFNYYSSLGWLIGGETKMRDWKAVARNWIMNQGKFNYKRTAVQNKPINLNEKNSKNYDEPL
jgi:hypothetical protein